MPLSRDVKDREYEKFFQTDADETAVRVGLTGALSPPVGTDSITAEYPNATTEIYRFRSGGVSGAILQSVTVIYTDATKDLISSVVKS